MKATVAMSKGIENRKDILDFVKGLTLMGTGGGGSPEVGVGALEKALERFGPIRWTPPEKLEPDEYTCTVMGIGSMAATSSAPPPNRVKTVALPHARAITELQEYCGRKISAVLAGELGAAITPNTILAARELGIGIVDGDYCGRAVPEFVQMLPLVKGVAPWPGAISDAWGNVLIMKRAADGEMAERLSKAISQITKEGDAKAICALACALFDGAETRRLVVAHTLTYCLEVGRTINGDVAAGRDPAQGLTAKYGWHRLFSGDVVHRVVEDRQGYLWSTTTIRGSGQSAGRTMKVWSKNEHHLAWVDDIPVAMSPDILAIMTIADGQPQTSASLAIGQRVVVVGLPHPVYRFSEGIECLSPRHFGFDIAYSPIENLAPEMLE